MTLVPPVIPHAKPRWILEWHAVACTSSTPKSYCTKLPSKSLLCDLLDAVMQGKLLTLRLLCCFLLVGTTREALGPVPPAANVSLHVSAGRFRIGDDIQVIFRLDNSGEEPFSYNYGGDYRGTGFPLRCKVVVKNSRGETMPDLAQDAPNMGGLCATPKLKPGETFDQALPLR